MIFFEHDVTDEGIMSCVHDLIDVLVRGDYEAFFASVGYTMDGDAASVDSIKSGLGRYRSDIYPGVAEFMVTDWRKAEGGNPEPKCEVIRYEPNSTGLVGAASCDLPLNGKWSDLCADFILVEHVSKQGYVLRLEEFCCKFFC
ncbi:MAG: hypothetical protein ACSHX6_01760 [Akkermansiaceae bacterium]